MSITMKFKIGGMLISLTCFILAGLFITGIVAGDPWREWAIIVPVIIFVAAALGIGFTVGRLMATTDAEKNPTSPKTPEKTDQ